MSNAPGKNDNLTAMGWALVSVLATSALIIATRASTDLLDPRFVVFVRFAGTVLIAAPLFVAIPASRKTLRISRPWLHLSRGVLFFVSSHLGFYAIAHLELVTATILMFTAPLFATLLGATFLGQTVGPRRLGAIAVGFLGITLILRPGLQPFEIAMLCAVGSAATFAGALILSRAVSSADGPYTTILTSALITALASIPVALPVATWPLNGATLLVLLAMIVAGMVRMFSDIRSYSLGDAAVIAPIVYLRLVLIAIGGYLIWDEVPTLWDVIGASIIISAALYIAHREARLSRAKS